MKKHLRIEDSRVAHMHGVAEYMSDHAVNYGLDPDYMYLLGFVHDIGYIYGKNNHEALGGMLAGLGTTIGECIYAHGMTPWDYADVHGIATTEIPNELILLWEADMMVDQTGEVVGFDKRLEDIAKRLGTESEAFEKCAETVRWLLQRNAPVEDDAEALTFQD